MKRMLTIAVMALCIGSLGALAGCASGGGGCGAGGCGSKCGGCAPDRNCCDGCRQGTGCTCVRAR
jgi:hypothetical protein